jgi:serine protease Do
MKKLLFFLFLFTAFQATSQLTPVQIAERNKPGTVMILAQYKGHVSAVEPEVNNEAITELAQQVKAEVDNGTITREQFWNVYLLAFAKNISQYVVKGTQTYEKDLDITMVGSGFIVTPDGYVITNAHVVDENDDETKKSFAEQSFVEILQRDVKTLEEAMTRPMAEDEKQAITDAYSWYFSQTMEVSEIQKNFYVQIGITGKSGRIESLRVPAKIVTQGAPIPGKDVAILKMSEKHQYPTIRVGDDQDMRIGDQVFVLGYPAVATFHPLISEESMAEASLTRGLVSARKSMKGGWDVLQIDAAITHGNSGGPVMNENGEVIGLATFGSIDAQRGQEVQGMNFIVPTTVVKEFIRKGNIHPAMSDISVAYEEAMDLFDQSHFKKALEKFNEVRDMNSSFPFIDKYVRDTKRKIDQGLDKPEKDPMMMYYIIGGGALLLIIVLVLLFRKRRKA